MVNNFNEQFIKILNKKLSRANSIQKNGANIIFEDIFNYDIDFKYKKVLKADLNKINRRDFLFSNQKEMLINMWEKYSDISFKDKLGNQIIKYKEYKSTNKRKM